MSSQRLICCCQNKWPLAIIVIVLMAQGGKGKWPLFDDIDGHFVS